METEQPGTVAEFNKQQYRHSGQISYIINIKYQVHQPAKRLPTAANIFLLLFF